MLHKHEDSVGRGERGRVEQETSVLRWIAAGERQEAGRVDELPPHPITCIASCQGCRVSDVCTAIIHSIRGCVGVFVTVLLLMWLL